MNRFDRLPHIKKRYDFREKLYSGTEHWTDTTLQRAFLEAVDRKPGQGWTFISGDVAEEMTLADVGSEARDFAARVAATDDTTPDDVIAIVLPNSAGAVTAFFGGQLLGMTPFPTSMREGEESLCELFASVGVSHVVVAEDDVPRREWVTRMIRVGQVKHLWIASPRGVIQPAVKTTRAASPHLSHPTTTDGVHLVAYTSGSTSKPKIVLHTDAELLAESRSLAEVFGFFGTMLVAAPVGHITGILHLFTLPLVRDGDVVSIDRWDTDAALEACRKFGAETIAGTSLYFQQLFDRDPSMGGIKGGIAGGGPVAPVIVQRAAEKAGIRVVRSYGSTEHPTISQSLPDDPVEFRAFTDGSLNSGVEVRILDAAGAELPVGSAGEIVSRGPDAMAGYLDPTLDAEFYSADGWFRTSDVGFLDANGNLTITDRLKDLIIRAGENISAKEVEDILHEWPAVQEVAVVGVPDPVYGERACAFILARDSEVVHLESLRAYLGTTRLERFKWPEYVEVVTSLPRTPAGKVSKQQLRTTWTPQNL